MCSLVFATFLERTQPDTTACPCCQGQLHKIGEDVSEVLDVIPAILRVLRTICPKYACRGCTDGVVQAKVLPHLIERAAWLRRRW